MTPSSGCRRQYAADKKEAYLGLLQEHLADPTEASLGKAYDLGRGFLDDGVSLLELVSIHHCTLNQIVSVAGPTGNSQLLKAGEFFSEVLSPYEMAQRGFHDAIIALRKMNETLEAEIKRIAYSVHDEASQLLVAVHLSLAELALDAPEHQQRFNHINSLLKQVENQLRQYSHELRPIILDHLGLAPAIRSLADAVSKRSHLPIIVSDQAVGRLPANIEIAVYRAAQEALSNAVKHARAKSISIEMSSDDSAFVCAIRDDGVGFSPEPLGQKTPSGGLGLVAMHERLHAVGGGIRLDSALGRGTTVSVWVPTGPSRDQNPNGKP